MDKDERFNPTDKQRIEVLRNGINLLGNLTDQLIGLLEENGTLNKEYADRLSISRAQVMKIRHVIGDWSTDGPLRRY